MSSKPLLLHPKQRSGSTSLEMWGRAALSGSSLPGISCSMSLECCAARVSTVLPVFQTHGPHWLGKEEGVSAGAFVGSKAWDCGISCFALPLVLFSD